MTIFNILYKRTKTGAVEYWKISTEDNKIITEYGQVGTTSPKMRPHLKNKRMQRRWLNGKNKSRKVMWRPKAMQNRV